MRPPARTHLAIGFLTAIVALAAVVAVAGAPPPTQLCGTCDSAIVDENASAPETLEIAIDEDGDSTWTERVPVTDERAEAYVSNRSLLEADLEESFYRSHVGGGFDDLEPSVALEGETVVVTYEIDDLARPGVGEAWLVDYFALGPSNDRYGLAVDRIDLQTPEGTAATNRPRFASVDGDTVTWERPAPDAPIRFDDQTHVTYGSDDGIVGWATGQATIARAVGPMVASQAVTGGVVPALVLGLAAVGVGRVRLARAGRLGGPDAPSLGRLLAAIGVGCGGGLFLLATIGTGSPRDPNAVVPGALGVGYAGLALAVSTDEGLETRGLLVRAIGTAALVGVLAWVLGGPVAGWYALWLAVPTALFLPIGHAAERDAARRVTIALVAILALAPILTTAAVAPAWSWGLGLALYVFLLSNWALVVIVFGAPLAFLGRRLAREATVAT